VRHFRARPHTVSKTIGRPAWVGLRGGARLVLGSDYPRVRTAVGESLRRREWRRSPLRRVTESYVQCHGLTVLGGPFAGLQYYDAAVPLVARLVPKLLGSYERELHEPLRGCLADETIDTVVNIGAADGYYAVGTARAAPRLQVYAYDSEPTARRLCRTLARRNGVLDRVELRGACALDSLRQLEARRVMMIVDCEGDELELLRPDLVPALHEATVIVELHDLIDSRISATLSERFRHTHSEERIPARPRFLHDHPEVRTLPGVGELERQLAISELRPTQMEWSVFRPREQGGSQCSTHSTP
jgi:predicted O-methyltransferase YrrM